MKDCIASHFQREAASRKRGPFFERLSGFHVCLLRYFVNSFYKSRICWKADPRPPFLRVVNSRGCSS